MAKGKGKYINFVGALMSLYKEDRAKVDEVIHAKTGKHLGEFENEEFYDTKIMKLALEAYAKASPTGRTAIITMGRNIYPLVKKTVGLPPEMLKTPLDALKFEAQNFLDDHVDDGGTPVIPRTFHLFEDGHVIVEAPVPDYDPLLMVGVFMGLFKVLGFPAARVEMIDEEKVIIDISW